jgi:hypothetical protein
LNNIPSEDAIEFLKRQLKRYLRQKTKANSGSASTWQQVIDSLYGFQLLSIHAPQSGRRLHPGIGVGVASLPAVWGPSFQENIGRGWTPTKACCILELT